MSALRDKIFCYCCKLFSQNHKLQSGRNFLTAGVVRLEAVDAKVYSSSPSPRPRCRVCKQNVEFLKEKTKLIFEDCKISVLHKVTDVRFVLKDLTQSIIKLIDSCSSSHLLLPHLRRPSAAVAMNNFNAPPTYSFLLFWHFNAH